MFQYLLSTWNAFVKRRKGEDEDDDDDNDESPIKQEQQDDADQEEEGEEIEDNSVGDVGGSCPSSAAMAELQSTQDSDDEGSEEMFEQQKILIATSKPRTLLEHALSQVLEHREDQLQRMRKRIANNIAKVVHKVTKNDDNNNNNNETKTKSGSIRTIVTRAVARQQRLPKRKRGEVPPPKLRPKSTRKRVPPLRAGESRRSSEDQAKEALKVRPKSTRKRVPPVRAGESQMSSKDQKGLVASPASAKQQRYKRKEKDEDAPMRPLSGYNFFLQDLFAKQRKKGGEFSHIATIGSKWQELSAAQRSRYHKRAREDSLRYEREMASYTPPKSARKKRRATKMG